MATFSIVVSVWQQTAKARDELARDNSRGFDTIANTGRALSKPETQHRGNKMGSTMRRWQATDRCDSIWLLCYHI